MEVRYKKGEEESHGPVPTSFSLPSCIDPKRPEEGKGEAAAVGGQMLY